MSSLFNCFKYRYHGYLEQMGLLLLQTINANLQTGQQSKRKQLSSSFRWIFILGCANVALHGQRSFRSDVRLQIYI